VQHIYDLVQIYSVTYNALDGYIDTFFTTNQIFTVHSMRIYLFEYPLRTIEDLALLWLALVFTCNELSLSTCPFDALIPSYYQR